MSRLFFSDFIIRSDPKSSLPAGRACPLARGHGQGDAARVWDDRDEH